MSSITTRTGDDGTTSLLYWQRVAKRAWLRGYGKGFKYASMEDE